MSHDVVVKTTSEGTFVVVDVEPRKPGELLTIDSMVNDDVVTVAVEVISCRPIFHRGDVRHELVMKSVEETR